MVNIFNDIRTIIDHIMVSTVAPDTIYINEKYLNSQTKKYQRGLVKNERS